MSLYDLIKLFIIVFIVASIAYLLLKYGKSIKSFLEKVADKTTNLYDKLDSKVKEHEQKPKELEYEEVKQLTYSGEEKSNKNSSKKTASSKKGEEPKQEGAKLKPSKAASEIRPVLLPPNNEQAQKDAQQLENQKANPAGTKSNNSLGFKYGAKPVVTQPVQPQPAQPQQPQAKQVQPVSSPKSAPRQNSSVVDADDFISFSRKEGEQYNPLKRDPVKQYEDIKNFLELPQAGQITANTGVSYNGSTFNTTDKIDPSLFNSPDSHFVDYRKQPIKSSSSIVTNYNTANNRPVVVNNSYNTPSYGNVSSGDVKYANTKYARKQTEDISAIANQNYNNVIISTEPESTNYYSSSDLKNSIINNILNRKTS